MATTASLSSATSDANGTAVQISGGGGAWVEIPGDSVFGGAKVIVQASTASTSAKFSSVGYIATLTSSGWVRVDLPDSTYVRLVLAGSGASTSITGNIVDNS